MNSRNSAISQISIHEHYSYEDVGNWGNFDISGSFAVRVDKTDTNGELSRSEDSRRLPNAATASAKRFQRSVSVGFSRQSIELRSFSPICNRRLFVFREALPFFHIFFCGPIRKFILLRPCQPLLLRGKAHLPGAMNL